MSTESVLVLLEDENGIMFWYRFDEETSEYIEAKEYTVC